MCIHVCICVFVYMYTHIQHTFTEHLQRVGVMGPVYRQIRKCTTSPSIPAVSTVQEASDWLLNSVVDA